jgi:two-component system chemotaxis sensor kinase CheA
MTLLVFGAGAGSPKAVPLQLVARLEELDLATVEYANGRPIVQYRDRLMPLVLMDESQTLATSGRRPVLVFTDGDHSMGLAVDEIFDIVETHVTIQLSSSRPGFLGSAIIEGRATDLVDIGHFLKHAQDDWFALASATATQPQLETQPARSAA